MLKNKKGQTSTLQEIVIGLLVIGIVLGLGILLVREMADTMTDQSATVQNETITPANGTIVWLANNQTNIGCWDDFGVTHIINDSVDAAEQFIASGNYTIDWRGGVIQAATGSELGDTWNVTYTYGYDDSAECKALEDTINATATIPGWLVIFVIIFIVGILLALVFRYLPTSPGGGVAEI